MAEQQNLEEKIHRLEELLKDQEMSAKLLVRRDLELARANQRLRDLDQVKSKFVSVAAHQMRTPLSAVRWALSMMLEGDLGAVSESQTRILNKALDSTNRLVRLIADLLDVDHLEAGKFIYTPTSFDITELVTSIADEASHSAKTKGVHLNVWKDQLPYFTIWGDPQKLRLAIQNLVENAIKYTPEGGEVTVSLLREGNETIQIQVKDSGIGIPQSDQRFIFNRFFRSANAMHTQTEGSGLGLYIAREIILYHGGSIRFESTENKGTTFFVTLPVVSKAAKTQEQSLASTV